jgi:hypothetical protein
MTIVWFIIANIVRRMNLMSDNILEKAREEADRLLNEPDHAVPLKDEDTPEGTFDLSLRIMNNEIIGFAMRVDDFKAKWLILGVLAIGVLAWGASIFGPAIQSTFGG